MVLGTVSHVRCLAFCGSRGARSLRPSPDASLNPAMHAGLRLDPTLVRDYMREANVGSLRTGENNRKQRE
jgi:hypothetical protein